MIKKFLCLSPYEPWWLPYDYELFNTKLHQDKECMSECRSTHYFLHHESLGREGESTHLDSVCSWFPCLNKLLILLGYSDKELEIVNHSVASETGLQLYLMPPHWSPKWHEVTHWSKVIKILIVLSLLMYGIIRKFSFLTTQWERTGLMSKDLLCVCVCPQNHTCV